VELQAHAKVRGDVRYKTLEMQPGAVVEGRLLHLASAEPAVVTSQDEA
jgi:cytoskeletal protein CcmA (bactofilin family)